MDQQNAEDLLNRNILIVDDDADTCTLLDTLFKINGYTTSVVNSGQDAINYVKTTYTDIIVLDIMMPEMDGWETYSKIRSVSDIPILFLTALASGDCAAEAIDIGGNDFVRKPFHPRELLARVNALLKNLQIPKTDLSAYVTKLKSDFVLPEVSVVIPAYNEEAALPLVLPAVFGVLDNTYEVLLVDDGSVDRTAEIARSYPCRLIRHPKNRGKGAALRTGLQEARGKKVIFLDADNTYPVEAIPKIARLLENNDLVRGIRNDGRANIPLLNRIGNFTFDRIIRLMNNVEGGDILSGMYGVKREKLLALDLQSEGFDIEAEICVMARAQNFKCSTLPITYTQRVGEKKLNAINDGLRILYRLAQLALSFSPLMIFIYPGMFLSISGIIGLYLIQFKQLHLNNLPFAMNGIYLFGALQSIGVQLIIFGTAVYAASMAYGLRGRANRILDKISDILSTRISMLFGSIFGVIGLIGTLWMSIDWYIHRGPFFFNSLQVIMSGLMVFGIQLVSAGVFLSALKGLRHGKYKTSKTTSESQVPLISQRDRLFDP